MRGTRLRALVVEDADEFALLAHRVLEREGYATTVVGSAEDALSVVPVLDPDVVLIDVTLPGMDGFDLCRTLRGRTDAFLVMVTGRGEEIERVIGLRLGADDYVVKPYSPAELAARLGALRRRPRRPTAGGGLVCGPLEVDEAAREVRVDGAVVALTRTEFDLLRVLAASPRHVHTREHLLQTVWGYASAESRVVDVHLGNLRRKMTDALGGACPIVTVRGVGYRFEPEAVLAG